MRHIVHSGPLTDRLDVDAFSVQVENVAAENGVLAHDRRRSHQFRHGVGLGFAIVVHQPHVRTRKRQGGAHALMKAAGAACVLFQANCVELGAAPRRLGCEQFARRLIGSIVDNHELTDRVSLCVNRLEASFKERWTVPRHDDCRYSYQERKSLIYEG